jgi:hypothetical protein
MRQQAGRALEWQKATFYLQPLLNESMQFDAFSAVIVLPK